MNRMKSMKAAVCSAVFAAVSGACVNGLSAVGVPSSGGYVNNGLVAHWDGIDNTLVGTERSHKPDATIWCDLTGNGGDLTLPSFVTVEGTSMLSVSDPSKDNNSCPVLSSITGLDISANTQYTVEVVTRRVQWRHTDNPGQTQAVIWTPRGELGYRYFTDDGFFVAYKKSATETKIFSFNAGVPAADMHTLCAVFGPDKAGSSFYLDGTRNFTLGESANDSFGSVFRFFANKRADIRVHAIRIYNRVLTANERKQNSQLDALRFRMARELPRGYKFVEYIESSGTQVIDTGYYPNPNTKMEASLQFIGEIDRNRYNKGSSPFGCVDSDDVCFSINFGGAAGQENKFYEWLNNDKSPYATFTITPEQRTTRQTWTVDATTGAIAYGDTIASSAQGAKKTTHTLRTLRLFAKIYKDDEVRPFSYYDMRVYGWKIWNGTTPVRDFVPCCRVPEMEAGLFDRVSGEFYANVGTGSFKYGKPTPTAALPTEYHSLNYLVSSGAQQIATGVEMADDVTVNALFSKLEGANACRSYTIDTDGNMFSMAQDGYAAIYAGRPSDGTPLSFLSAGDLIEGQGRLYSAHIWKNGELVRNFEPCYRVADGVAGMYDTVGGLFYPSAGAEAFMHGAGGECGVASFGGERSGMVWPGNFGVLTNFSFSVWVRNPSVGAGQSYGTIVSQGALGGTPGFCCFVSDGGDGKRSLKVQLRDAENNFYTLEFPDAETLSDDKWHHLAYVCDYHAGVARFYVDGKVVASGTDIDDEIGEPDVVSGMRFAVGGRSDAYGNLQHLYRGELAQLSFWSKALKEGEVARLRMRPADGTEPGLFEAWTFAGSVGLAGLVSGDELSLKDGIVGFVPGEVKWYVPGVTIYLR